MNENENKYPEEEHSPEEESSKNEDLSPNASDDSSNDGTDVENEILNEKKDEIGVDESSESEITSDLDSNSAESCPVDDNNSEAYSVDSDIIDNDNAEPCSIDGKDDQTEESIKKSRKTKKKRAVSASSIACVLSACSIFLLVALSVALLLGLVPMDGNRIVYVNVSDANSPFISGDAKPETLDGFMDSVVIVNAGTLTGDSVGTGIVMSADGYIITNYHVVESSSNINVFFYDAKSTPVPARLIGHSEIDDIAVLKVEKTGLKAATFAKSANCKTGERVYAVGTPEGMEFGWSVTQGIVSNKNREILLYDNEGILEKKMYVIQTDAPVNPGNSGGPLINANGHVIGIVTLKLSASTGMGFAIPSDGALEIVNAIIKYGNADNVNSSVSSGRPLVGITGVGVEGKTWYANVKQGADTAIREVDEAYAKQYPSICFYAPIDGVYVSAVTEGLDAANHLKAGDVITEINKTKVEDIYDVMAIINTLDGGDKITVKYYRDSEYHTAEITLGTQK